MFTAQSPYHPHHLGSSSSSSSSPVGFMLDSASPFYAQQPSPACSSMSSPSSSSGSASRNRALVACDYCRHRKIKCDTGSPCVNCVRTKRQCQYTEVSDDQNRAARERKAAAKAMKIQSLGLVEGASPRSVRGFSSASSSASSSKPSTPLLEGWSPVQSSVPSTPFKRPFPSVLQSTPLHEAYKANVARSNSDCPTSPAEDHTYFHIQQRKSTAVCGSNTPPRSRSPSPNDDPQYAAFMHSTPVSWPTLAPPPGYTSYFPHSDDSTMPQWSPAMSSASTSFTHSAPYTPIQQQHGFPSSPGFSKTYLSARHPPSSPPLSPEQDGSMHPFAATRTPAYSSSSSLASSVAPSPAAFFMPPSPTSATSAGSTFASMQMMTPVHSGNPGLGLALPEGFAPGMPLDEGYYEQELAQEEQWARGRVEGCQMEVQQQQEPELIVFQGWGTA